jgi:predicted kinase
LASARGSPSPVAEIDQDGCIARLILLNGPPGIGKSTVARRWVADQTTAVVVEIDALRTSIEGWQDDDHSKLEARRMAIDVADAHLRGGYDVIVPQYLGRTEFIDELERTAIAASASFVLVILTGDEDDIVARFEHRRASLSGDDHPEQEVDDVRVAIRDALSLLEQVAQLRPNAPILAVDADHGATAAWLGAILSR